MARARGGWSLRMQAVLRFVYVVTAAAACQYLTGSVKFAAAANANVSLRALPLAAPSAAGTGIMIQVGPAAAGGRGRRLTTNPAAAFGVGAWTFRTVTVPTGNWRSIAFGAEP